MAGLRKYAWPSDDDLVALIVECATVNEAAIRLDIPATSISNRLRDRQLAGKVEAARLRRLKPKAPKPKVDETRALKQELSETRAALSKALAEDTRERRVIRALQGAVEARAPLYRPAARKPAKRHAHSFVLLWSDVHAGEVVDRAEVGGMNSYDWTIMRKRHQELFAAVASYAEHRNYDIGELVVAALGDILSGNIHDELKETNEMPLQEAIIQAGLDAADWLEQFLELFSRIRFAGVIGNHGRDSKKPKAKHKYANADWLCYHVMQQRLRKQEAIRFEIPKSSRHLLSILRRQLLLFHGDSVGPSAMVGVPWGGIIRHVDKLRNQYGSMGTAIDHFLCGHFHQANTVSAKRIIVNGSVIGGNEYGLERYGEAGRPEQILLTFNQNHGLVDVSFLQLKAGL